MPIYVKFMKEILSRKEKLKLDENTTLAEECYAIIPRKLPQKLIVPSSFIISCSIGSLTINHALCNLGASINLMSLSMMRELKCGEPKQTNMILALVDRLITYPYGVLEDVLISVDRLLFLDDFVILDTSKDFEISLMLGRKFLATSKSLIDVVLGQLILRFNKEKVVFNLFEALKPHKEIPQCY
ncbi:uncharacterized protein LOC131624380 [Vicia villosa]|uniref:uncharacterized protein LOC131624380 n=1 Tax=Vicia villosa TaxID=3911 RepID=UPI00273C53BB|nr:uncharacterized protein LOC131624380 [Vicia villosa]